MATDERNDIVSMLERKAMRTDNHVRLVETYWRSLVQDGNVPLRSLISPRDIQDALEFAFIAEAVTPAMAKLRVAGSHLGDLMGMSAGGMPLGTLFETNARPELAEATRQMFETPAIVRVACTSPAGLQRQPITGQLLLLPLRSDMGDVTRALGVFVTDGRIGRAPRKFQIDHVFIETITEQTGRAGVTPSPLEAVPAKPVIAGETRATTPRPMADKPRGPAPFLKLVVSND